MLFFHCGIQAGYIKRFPGSVALWPASALCAQPYPNLLMHHTELIEGQLEHSFNHEQINSIFKSAQVHCKLVVKHNCGNIALVSTVSSAFFLGLQIVEEDRNI